MIKFSRTVLNELEEELRIISFDYDNPISMCDKSIEKIVLHLEKLKNFLITSKFVDEDEEIHFFKNIKPKFTSKLIYFKKVKNLETRKPTGSRKMQREYLDNELDKLNIYFSENLEFFNYYRTGAIFVDKNLFVRYNSIIDYNLEIFYHEKDQSFSTSHDFKVGTILAHDIFQKYIENKIRNLSDNNQKPVSIQLVNKILKWTGSKTSLIELIYALHTQKVFNDGKAELSEIAKHFEKIFDIELGDIYRACNEIKNRKINKTKFIDELSENLNKRFDENEFK